MCMRCEFTEANDGLEDDCFFFFSSRRRHTRFDCDWSSDVCSSDLKRDQMAGREEGEGTNIEQAVTHEDGTGRVAERARKLKDYHTSITEGYGPSIEIGRAHV